jgi:predicted  nucleic acid-binding Zn-ribbon protein
MSLNIHFFKNDVNFRKIRKDIDTLQETLRSVQDKIEPLEKGIKELESNPDKYKAYNPPDGWGSYEDFVRF